MGSGKTILVIALAELYDEYVKIVVVPASLRKNFKYNIYKYYNISQSLSDKDLPKDFKEKLDKYVIVSYEEFKNKVYNHRENIVGLIRALNDDGKKIIGYGASTKGNILLQFCGLTDKEIPFIAEVNQDKFGCVTPGSNIPIISETEARKMKPDYLFILPWHFKNGILQREKEFISNGGKFIVPLPEIQII